MDYFAMLPTIAYGEGWQAAMTGSCFTALALQDSILTLLVSLEYSFVCFSV
jgi:hypothetical protein